MSEGRPDRSIPRSSIAALCAVVLTLAGDVSKWSLATSVLLVGAIASWIQSGHTMRAALGETRTHDSSTWPLD